MNIYKKFFDENTHICFLIKKGKFFIKSYENVRKR